MAKKIDIWLLSGYLGSGKTTALNQLLKQPMFADGRLALIINEFGKVGVDGKLIDEGDYAKFEINKGSIFCICTKTDLLKIFSNIIDNDLADTVIVEVSGVAEPSDIEQLITEDYLVQKLNVRANLCFVDAVNYTKVSAFMKNAVMGVRVADGIIINKTDLVSETIIKDLKDRLNQLNDRAPIVSTSFGKIDDGFLDSLNHVPASKAACLCPPLEMPVVSFSTDRIMKRSAFEAVIMALADNILRLKGNISFDDGHRFVEMVLSEKTETEPIEGFDKATSFTAIGWDIEQVKLQQDFEACFLEEELD
ncbi:MAG: GTP-binding protein [Phycisphaerae bacterium]|nr:GTP-binding protein [Phycisphaerae bacterium]